ncbi:MAG: LuxR C-terminal-related transcriptional regulator [Candidatus Binatus sp.]|uniref:helix-turn-helix transcriptional regulator n=1 Tax=Candidatus Binatus sp. TaxID=2811406 RepID=UPI002721FAAA|nr:LuxR C-terminal-related transcriptional regulator [Candidatus Binatus sp.]MDO8431623.1 LuxR C-terminal-related transcriptional regulator [Candidatus Binatus sp.]
MPLSLAEFSELVGLIYQGPLESVPFKSALESIRRLLRANYVTLILRPPSSNRSGLMVNASGDRPVEREADYSNYYYAFDVFVGLPTDHVVTAEELLGRRWRDSEIYQQFLRPVDVLHALGADIHTDDGVECRFRVARSHAEVNFSATDKAICTALLPHLKRAVQIHSQLDLIESERKLLAGTVDRMLVGTIILDERGAILKTNDIAREMVRAGDGIREVTGAMQAVGAGENRELQRLIKQALGGNRADSPAIIEAMSITRPSGRGKLGVLIRSNPPGEWSEGQRRPSVAVFIRDPERRSEASVEMVRRLFDLTAAEASLAIALANGLTLEDAAGQLGIRKNTARAHLRSIFSKIGITRQTTLVRTLLSSVIWLG